MAKRQSLISGHVKEKRGDHLRGEVDAVIYREDEGAQPVTITVRYAIDQIPSAIRIAVGPSSKASTSRPIDARDLQIPVDAYAMYAAALVMRLPAPSPIVKIVDGDGREEASPASHTWAMPILRENSRVQIGASKLVSLGQPNSDEAEENYWLAMENAHLATLTAQLRELRTNQQSGKSARRAEELDHELKKAADIYRTAADRGRSPVAEIAKALHVSNVTAWRRTQEAIRAGYLDEAIVRKRTRQGKSERTQRAGS